MQNLINGDVPDPKERDEQSLGRVGPNSFSNIPADPLFSQGGILDSRGPVNFNIGKPINVKPTKTKRSVPLFRNRPTPISSGVDRFFEDPRPLKRSRAVLEGACNSGDQVRSEGSGGSS
ncbi:hypothetical protein Hanom_Chr05g00461371 [Helianthus anomalus]